MGEGYARIGECSGSTNVLTGSGVDEAWTTGTQLAEAVLELLKAGKPLSKANLEATYVARRRASWVEEEGKAAEKARDGFHRGMIPGLLGTAIAGFTDGKHAVSGEPRLMPAPEEYYREKIPAAELTKIMESGSRPTVNARPAMRESPRRTHAFDQSKRPAAPKRHAPVIVRLKQTGTKGFTYASLISFLRSIFYQFRP